MGRTSAVEERSRGRGALPLVILVIGLGSGCPEAGEAPAKGAAEVDEATSTWRIPLPEPLAGGVPIFTFDLEPYGGGTLVFDAQLPGGRHVEERRWRTPQGDLRVVHVEDGRTLSDLRLVGDTLYERTAAGCRTLHGPDARALHRRIADAPTGSLILTSPLALLTEGVSREVARPSGEDAYRFEVDTIDASNAVHAEGSIRLDAQGRPVHSEGVITLTHQRVAEARAEARWRFDVDAGAPPSSVGVPEGCVGVGNLGLALAALPRPDDARPLYAMEESAAWGTALDLASVVRFYEARLRSEGWSVVKKDLSEGDAALRFARADDMLLVSVSGAEGGSRVTLALR